MLFSPFKSIKDVAKDKFPYLSVFVRNKFSNKDLITSMKCPVLFIHGQEDDVISYGHSKELYNLCPNNVHKEKVFPTRMNHNQFRFQEDLVVPLKAFLK